MQHLKYICIKCLLDKDVNLVDKKLPKIYVNKIDKILHNNKIVSYSKVEKEIKEDYPSHNITKEKNIEEIVDRMLHSPNYVYKINAVIITKDGRKLNKDIIGKVDDKIITIDEELILISDIEDIKY
jgi:hypothetical protein